MSSNRTPFVHEQRRAAVRRAAAPGAALAALALLLASAVPAAQALEIKLPPETAQYRESDLPGFQLAQRNCLICHSAQYVMTQPPGSRRTYWEATVKKMKHPFGAPLPDEAIAPIVDYLVKTYGAEQPQVDAGSAGAPMPASPTATAGSLNVDKDSDNKNNNDNSGGGGKP